MAIASPYAQSILQSLNLGGKIGIQRRLEEEEKRQQAGQERQMVTNALAGLVVAILSGGLGALLGPSAGAAGTAAGAGLEGTKLASTLTPSLTAAPTMGSTATGLGAITPTALSTVKTAAPSMLGKLGATAGAAAKKFAGGAFSPENLLDATQAGMQAGQQKSGIGAALAGIQGPMARAGAERKRQQFLTQYPGAGEKMSIDPMTGQSTITLQSPQAPGLLEQIIQMQLLGSLGGQEKHEVGDTITNDETGEKARWDGRQWISTKTGLPVQI